MVKQYEPAEGTFATRITNVTVPGVVSARGVGTWLRASLHLHQVGKAASILQVLVVQGAQQQQTNTPRPRTPSIIVHISILLS